MSQERFAPRYLDRTMHGVLPRNSGTPIGRQRKQRAFGKNLDLSRQRCRFCRRIFDIALFRKSHEEWCKERPQCGLS